MKPWVVIPAFNEQAAVGDVVRRVRPFAGEVVVVDDGSADGTYAAAAEAGAVTLRHAVNRGYGAALVTGSQYALEHGASTIVHFDADGQFEETDIPRLAAALTPGSKSAALGSRFLGTAVGLPKLRRVTLKLAILFTWAVSGVRLTDAHNGFRAFTKEAWREFRLRQDRMAFSSELVDELVRTGTSFVEVPVTVKYTEYSKRGSKQGSLPAVRIVKDIFLGKFIR